MLSCPHLLPAISLHVSAKGKGITLFLKLNKICFSASSAYLSEIK